MIIAYTKHKGAKNVNNELLKEYIKNQEKVIYMMNERIAELEKRIGDLSVEREESSKFYQKLLLLLAISMIIDCFLNYIK